MPRVHLVVETSASFRVAWVVATLPTLSVGRSLIRRLITQLVVLSSIRLSKRSSLQNLISLTHLLCLMAMAQCSMCPKRPQELSTMQVSSLSQVEIHLAIGEILTSLMIFKRVITLQSKKGMKRDQSLFHIQDFFSSRLFFFKI